MRTNIKLNTSIPDRLFETYTKTLDDGIKLTAEDKLEIIEKLQLLELIFDTRRFDDFEAILTDDFVLDHAISKCVGKEAFAQLWRENEAVLLDGLRHQQLNIIVYPAVDGTASSICYLNVLKFADNPNLSASDTPVLVAHGIQVTNFRKENSAWKIARITIDQMAVSKVFPIDEQTRRYFAAKAKERDQIRQPLF